MTSADVDTYLAALPPDQREALATLRARLRARLPHHVEGMSYAMPGFRQPGPKGRMVVGDAAFARHLGLYPHSGTVIPNIDCTPFKTSKSGILFTPDRPLPDTLLDQIIRTRQAELAAVSASPSPLPFHLGPNIPAGGSNPSARTDT